MPRKQSNQNRAAAEIDPRFQPVVDAFTNYPDVRGGKMMSSYGLKVNGKIFAIRRPRRGYFPADGGVLSEVGIDGGALCLRTPEGIAANVIDGQFFSKNEFPQNVSQ